MRDAEKGIGTAFAVVNTGTTDAMVTATLYSNGVVIAQTTFSLAAGEHIARFVNEIFAPLSDPGGRSFSHVVLESTVATLAITALIFEGTDAATFPVNRLDGSPGSSGTTVVNPAGSYAGILLVATHNCSSSSDVTNFFLNGSFALNASASGVSGTGDFQGTESGDTGTVTVSFSGGLTSTGQLTGGTFMETNTGFEGGTGSGSGTATGQVDGTNVDLTVVGSDTWVHPSGATSSCDFIATFLQP